MSSTLVVRAWTFTKADGRGLCALSSDGATKQEVRTFPTTTSGLLALADWLELLGVQHAWRWRPPACTGSQCGTCSRGHFTLVLASRTRQEPARTQTDVNDAMWLADLLAPA